MGYLAQYFRDQLIAAPLKHRGREIGLRNVFIFPRSADRGPIEALLVTSSLSLRATTEQVNLIAKARPTWAWLSGE